MTDALQNLRIKKIAIKPIQFPVSIDKLSVAAGNKKGRCLLLSMNHRDFFGRFTILSFEPLFSAEYENSRLYIRNRENGKDAGLEITFYDALKRIFAPIPGSEEKDSPFGGLWTGFINYNALKYIENVPLPKRGFFNIPDLRMNFSDSFIIKDHLEQETYLLLLDTNLSTRSIEEREKAILEELETTPAYKPLNNPDVKIRSYISKPDYIKKINIIKEYINSGDIYQANFAYPMSIDCAVDSASLFTQYVKKNPVDFAGFLNFSDIEILSLSPECFFTLYDDTVKSYPIKGTIKRGATPEEDILLRKQLLNSDKDLAELSMIVDLIRNDIGKIADIGSVKVKQHASLETFHTLYHLYSLVQGKITDRSRADLILSMFPGGSVTGTPKVRAMEIISELERYRRDIYTGSIGWAGYWKDMSFNIAIRTIQRKKNRLYYFVGGGIVFDSQPESEFEETLTKAKSFHNIFTNAEFI